MISTEDIKLDKGLMTGTIEIDKVHAESKKMKGGNYEDDTSEFGKYQTERIPSESDLS